MRHWYARVVYWLTAALSKTGTVQAESGLSIRGLKSLVVDEEGIHVTADKVIVRGSLMKPVWTLVESPLPSTRPLEEQRAVRIVGTSPRPLKRCRCL